MTKAIGTIIAASVMCAWGSPVSAQQKFCSATADAILQSCNYEVLDDFHKALAICINVSDGGERQLCNTDAVTARDEAEASCGEQHANRLAFCPALGEGRYDPDDEPLHFDPDFAKVTLNPFFPLKIGNRWTYGGSEDVVVEVLNQTKLIEELTCVVVRDKVSKGGRVAEDTNDWFAQGLNGDVFYCGEEVKDYDTFAGDQPPVKELVRIDGSFKHGRNGDVGGISLPGRPRVGLTYRQEFSVANAEDAARVMSINYRFGSSPALDRNVPKALADALCTAGCVVTKEFNLTEPGVFAYKYYARGIGFFLDIKSDSNEVLRLTGCNFDTRCDHLPK